MGKKLKFNYDELNIDTDEWVDRLHDYVTSDEFKEVEASIRLAMLDTINKQLLDSTNYLIKERKQHNQNYYESILRHREILLLYNDINESSEVTAEQMKRYKELIK